MGEAKFRKGKRINRTRQNATTQKQKGKNKDDDNDDDDDDEKMESKYTHARTHRHRVQALVVRTRLGVTALSLLQVRLFLQHGLNLGDLGGAASCTFRGRLRR